LSPVLLLSLFSEGNLKAEETNFLQIYPIEILNDCCF